MQTFSQHIIEAKNIIVFSQFFSVFGETSRGATPCVAIWAKDRIFLKSRKFGVGAHGAVSCTDVPIRSILTTVTEMTNVRLPQKSFDVIDPVVMLPG